MATRTERFRAVDVALGSAKEAGDASVYDNKTEESILKERQDEAIKDLTAQGWTDVTVKLYDRGMQIDVSYTWDDSFDRKLMRKALLGKLGYEASVIIRRWSSLRHDDIYFSVKVKRVKRFVPVAPEQDDETSS